MPDLIGWTAQNAPLVLRTAREHAALSAAALGLVLAVGLPLGMALARTGRLAGAVVGLANVLRTVPSLALLVIMLPVLGTGFPPSLVALTLYGLPAVLLNTIVGLREVDADIVEAGRGQGLSEGQILRDVQVPLALPVILAGIRTAAVQIVSAATLAVFIGGGGLGELISSGLALMDMAQLVAGAVLVAALAIATEISLGALQRAMARRFGPAA